MAGQIRVTSGIKCDDDRCLDPDVDIRVVVWIENIPESQRRSRNGIKLVVGSSKSILEEWKGIRVVRWSLEGVC